MLKLVILGCVIVLANGIPPPRKESLLSRDQYDDLSHLENNAIPNYNDFYDYEFILNLLNQQKPLQLRPNPFKFSDIPKELQEQATESSNTEPTTLNESDDITTTAAAPTTEENGNFTLPDFTVDEDGYFVYPGIGRFKLHSVELQWKSAREQCLQEEGDLAIPDTYSKIAVFLQLFKMYPEIPATAILRDQVYIGIEDPEDERNFVTVHGVHVSIDEPIWASGEPDNQSPGKEDCVTFRTDARIRDVPCHFYLPFFCEKPL